VFIFYADELMAMVQIPEICEYSNRENLMHEKI